MNRHQQITLVLTACLALITVTQSAGQHPDIPRSRSIPDAARDLAPNIAKELKVVAANRGEALVVGVFAFGNEEGKVGVADAFASKTLPGEITTQLRNHAARKFVVLDPFELKKNVVDAGADTAMLKTSAFKEAAGVLKQIGLDAAVIGKYQKAGRGGYNVHADVLFDDGAPLQVSSKIDMVEPVSDEGAAWPERYSSRFSVQFFVDKKRVPMSREQGFSGKYILNLNREQHHGKPFALRIINNSMPPVGWIAPNEAEERTRFFTVAAYVDGVNSIYEPAPDGQFYPSQAHPNNATKWVLGRYGYDILPGYDSDRNAGAQRRARGYGDALQDIIGYQLNGERAAKFIFTNVEDAFANEVGITKEVGVISLYFYAEKLDGDQVYFGPGMQGAPLGAGQGPIVKHKVFKVRVTTHKEPVEVWNIFYRYDGATESVTDRNIVSIATAKAEVDQRIRMVKREFGTLFPPPPGRRGRGFGGRNVGSAAPR